MKKILLAVPIVFGVSALLFSCTEDNYPEDPVFPESPADVPELEDNYPMIPELESLGLGPDARGQHILDFSRVGYKWGDEDIPDLPVVSTIEPPAGGKDATGMINAAITETYLAGGGAILLKAGEYMVSGVITLNRDRVVLRGEGSDPLTGTRLISTSTAAGYDASGEPDTFIWLQGTGRARNPQNVPATPNIIDEYVPSGRFWVRVNDPDNFEVGDDVVVERCVTDQWIAALGMTGYTGWTTDQIGQKLMERVVTKKVSDTLWFENPLAIAIESEYGGGKVYKYVYDGDRLTGSGIENMYLTTVSTDILSENHRAAAISVNRAIHCWVRNVDSRRFAFSGVDVRQYAKNITVENCRVFEMHGQMTGSRRYPFHIKGQLVLMKDCWCETSRHAYSTSSPTANGPNVFLNCEGISAYYDSGPHQRMATGTLYDNINLKKTTVPIGGANLNSHWNAALAMIDRGDVDGHGWAELNGAIWNCTSEGYIAVQQPGITGTNYSVGNIGNTGWNGTQTEREPGVILSYGTHVSPQSLYEAQLALRKSNRPGGVMDVR